MSRLALVAVLFVLLALPRATLAFGLPPELSESFNPSQVALYGSTSMNFVVSNPNATLSLTGIHFQDDISNEGMFIDFNHVDSSCGGQGAALSGGILTVSLASLAPNGTCTVFFPAEMSIAGTINNSADPIGSDQTTTGEGASASITVVAPPTASKHFGVSGMGVGDTTSLSFLISNPAPVTQTGILLNDPLPAGLLIATPNGLSGACGGGTISAPAGGTHISLTGASMPASGSCQFSINVTATASGEITNDAGVSSTTGGLGGDATATIQINNCAGGAPYQNLSGNWLGLPGAVNLLGANKNAGNTTSVWALGTNAVPGGCGIYQYVGGAATWAAINGGATSLTVDNTGQPWVLQSGFNHAIYRFSGGVFSAIPGAAYEISAGAGGDVWVIGTNQVNAFGHGIYQYVGAPNWWQPINGAADHLAVAPDHSVWVLQSNGDIYRYANGSFTNIPGKAQQISAGYDGSIYVVGVNQIPGGYGLYRYVGAPAYWQAINGAAVQIVGGGPNEFWVHQGGAIPPVPNALGASLGIYAASSAPPAPAPTSTPTPLSRTPSAAPPTPQPGNRLPTPTPTPTRTPAAPAAIVPTPGPSRPGN